ncbi:hypothetical protein pb186bvf_011680 [Paramecium bursaria]
MQKYELNLQIENPYSIIIGKSASIDFGQDVLFNYQNEGILKIQIQQSDPRKLRNTAKHVIENILLIMETLQYTISNQ